MRRLHYTLDAEVNLTEIARYIARQSGSHDVARNFVSRLRGQCRRLAELPGTLGTARPDLRAGIRSTPFLGYVIFFRYREDRLEIVNVFEGHRDAKGYFSP